MASMPYKRKNQMTITIEDIIKITLKEQDLSKTEDELRLKYKICTGQSVEIPQRIDFSEKIEQIYEALDEILDLMGINELNSSTVEILEQKEIIEKNLEFIYKNN